MHLLLRKSEAYSDFVGKSEFLEPLGLTAQVLNFSIASTGEVLWLFLPHCLIKALQ